MTVRFETSDYARSNRWAPRGRGQWIFRVSRSGPADATAAFVTFSGTYTEAKAQCRRWVSSVGFYGPREVVTARVQP